MAFLFYFSDENQIKAGQLNVMQALVDILLQHKVDSRVAKTAAGALQNICMKGDLLITILTIFFCRTYSLNTDMRDAFLYICIFIWRLLYFHNLLKNATRYFHHHMSLCNQFVQSFYIIVSVPLAALSIPVYKPIKMMSFYVFGTIKLAFLFVIKPYRFL